MFTLLFDFLEQIFHGNHTNTVFKATKSTHYILLSYGDQSSPCWLFQAWLSHSMKCRSRVEATTERPRNSSSLRKPSTRRQKLFTFFRKLSAELILEVWRAALPDSCAIVIYPHWSSQNATTISKGGTRKLSRLVQVELRSVILESYQPVDGHRLGLSLANRQSKSIVMVDLYNDIL